MKIAIILGLLFDVTIAAARDCEGIPVTKNYEVVEPICPEGFEKHRHYKSRNYYACAKEINP